MQEGLEHLLYTYGVDLAIWSHMHSYERSLPIYNFKFNASILDPYINPSAPGKCQIVDIHLMCNGWSIVWHLFYLENLQVGDTQTTGLLMHFNANFATKYLKFVSFGIRVFLYISRI